MNRVGSVGRRRLLPGAMLLVAVVLAVAGCGSSAGPTLSAGVATTAGTPVPTVPAPTTTPVRATPKPTPAPKPTPFPAAGVKWLKAYCPAAKQFVGIVAMYQGIQGDMASLNFGDIQPRATKMLAAVVKLEALVKKIPNWGPGAAASSSLTTAVTKLRAASDMFQKAFSGGLPDIGALGTAAQTGLEGLAAGTQAASAMGQVAVLTGKDCTGIVPGT